MCLGVVVVYVCTKVHVQDNTCLHTTKHVRCVHMLTLYQHIVCVTYNIL